jgi:hypothetical protein
MHLPFYKTRVASWIMQQEEDYRFVILKGDLSNEAWAAVCVSQVTHVYVCVCVCVCVRVCVRVCVMGRIAGCAKSDTRSPGRRVRVPRLRDDVSVSYG